MNNKKDFGTNHSGSSGMHETHLKRLFEDGLKDTYAAEKAVTNALPSILKKVSSSELTDAIKSHQSESEKHLKKLETVFENMNQSPSGNRSEAMEGLISEANRTIDACDAGPMRDACIISALQKVEHYEIASYGTLSAFAKTLSLDDATSVLDEILEEEKSADRKLTDVAVSTINMEAAEEVPGEEEE
jgi:ferritin-like metal-binding protein YciE